MLKSTEIKPTLSAEEKRRGLDLVLRSQSFALSHQLRDFLKFICNREIEGRAEEIKEYLIGVEVFGRPSSYSTGEDSIVRSRAHQLRRKLEEVYKTELQTVQCRIEVPKGSYHPQFYKQEPIQTASQRIATLPDSTRISHTPSSVGIAPIMTEFWGPLLSPDSHVLLCIASPAHLLVRDYGGKTPPLYPQLLPSLPDLHELHSWYRQRSCSAEDSKLYMQPTRNSVLWGDAAGALIVARVLSVAGASFQVVPESSVRPFAMRGRNVILFGRSEYSPAVSLFTEKCPFQIRYAPSASDSVIACFDPMSLEEVIFAPQRDERHQEREVFGLITVLPSEGTADSEERTVIFSGINSAGIQAAAEFFCSPSRLLEFKERLNQQFHSRIPFAYQVVVRTTSDVTSDTNLPLTVSYETHRLVQER